MLNDLLGPLEKDQQELAMQKNGPHELVLPPTVRPEKMKDIATSMEEALQSPGTAEEKEVVPLSDPINSVVGRGDWKSNVAGFRSMEQGGRQDRVAHISSSCRRRLRICSYPQSFCVSWYTC